MRRTSRTIAFGLVAAISTAAAADKMYAVTPSGAAEMIFAQQPQDVVGKLSSKCIDIHWIVTSTSSNEVVCEAPLNAGQSVLGQLLLGNSYSTPPRRYFRFNVGQVDGVSRVQASGWMELQMAFGQTKRSDFSGPTFENGIMRFMETAGGEYPVGTTFPNHVYMGVKENRAVPIGKEVGLQITSFEPDAPAEKADLQVGDIVTKIAGKSFKNADGFLDAAAKAAEAPTYEIEILRDNKPMKFTLARAYRPNWAEAVKPTAPLVVGPTQSAGMSVADEILKLKKLKDDGVITPAEFDTQKAKLLGEQK